MAERCKMPGCSRPRLAHGLCSTHEMRRRAGQTLSSPVQEHHRWPDKTVRAARRMREGGAALVTIAGKLGVPRTTVQHWIHGRRRAA